MFTSGIQNVYSGLLDNPPPDVKNKHELISLINHCAKQILSNVSDEKVKQYHKTQTAILKKLRKAIEVTIEDKKRL